MDYKKILKKRSTREKILRFLSFVPDTPTVSFQYYMKTGHKLNLNSPKRYTEKIQWYKLFYRDPRMLQCVDKYDVREYIASIGYGNILNECFGIYNHPSEIDFECLPQSFVLKDTLGGGGSAVIIVKDKSKVDWNKIYNQMTSWISIDPRKKHPGREWVYDGKKHRIIVEKYIESDQKNGGLIDYKFLCFNGSVEVVYVLADRDLGNGAGCGIFSPDYKLLPVNELDETPLSREIPKPKLYDQMLDIATNISAPFPEARVDLYCEKDRIIFGEITFFDSSGYMLFDPDEFDFTLGDKFLLPRSNH